MKLIIEPFILFLEIEDSSFNRSAFSSFALELSSDFVEFVFLKVALSSHLFNEPFKLFTFSLEFFCFILVLLNLSLLILTLES